MTEAGGVVVTSKEMARPWPSHRPWQPCPASRMSNGLWPPSRGPLMSRSGCGSVCTPAKDASARPATSESTSTGRPGSPLAATGAKFSCRGHSPAHRIPPSEGTYLEDLGIHSLKCCAVEP